jgi:hypothetical protein
MKFVGEARQTQLLPTYIRRGHRVLGKAKAKELYAVAGAGGR